MDGSIHECRMHERIFRNMDLAGGNGSEGLLQFDLDLGLDTFDISPKPHVDRRVCPAVCWHGGRSKRGYVRG
jgi:hypothetical protein